MTGPQNGPSRTPHPGIGPGWHPDPSGSHQVRYWDGSRWTEHVGDGGRAAVDPLPPVVRPGAVAAGAQPDTARRPGCLTALLAFLAAVGAFAAVLLGAAFVLDLGLADDPPWWLRPVAIGVALATLFAVLSARRRRAPPTGRY